jgi:hypothetical protein
LCGGNANICGNQQFLKLIPDRVFNSGLVKKLGNLAKPGFPATPYSLLGYN